MLRAGRRRLEVTTRRANPEKTNGRRKSGQWGPDGAVWLCPASGKRYRSGVDSGLEDWFRREILPYEAALMRYLTQKRAMQIDAEDLRNDIYIRVLEAAAVARPAIPRAFLFSTARNLLIDIARRHRVVAIDLLEDLDALNVLIDHVSPERQASGRQQLQRLSALFDRMPAKCRRVFWMRRIDGLSQKQVAQRLSLTEATVEKHVYRALRFLADALYGNAETKNVSGEESRIEAGPHRGE
jgi:RNA polymerase sigma factor (sigma-70 family)